MSKNKTGPQNRQFASALLVLEFQMPYFGSWVKYPQQTRVEAEDVHSIKNSTPQRCNFWEKI